MLTDSHCHLTDARFDDDLPQVLNRARAAGVGRIVSIASTAEDAEVALALARREAGVWSTAGVHPHEAAGVRDGDFDRIRDLLSEPEVVAVGEAGLDYHYDNSPRATQRKCFQAQLDLARDLDLPIVVHSRTADEDMAAFLSDVRGQVRGVLHCFSGGPELLDLALDAGWYIGYGGVATFKKFDAVDLLRAVPDDRLLVETDAPYLAPVPNRGKRNEPAWVALATTRIAELRGQDPDDLARTTTENAARLFRLTEAEAMSEAPPATL